MTVAAAESRRESRWRGLLLDLLLGGVPGVLILLYSVVILTISFATLRSDGLGWAALLFLLGTLGILACLSLLTVLVRFAWGLQGSLTPRLTAFLRWGLVAGICLSTAAILFLFAGIASWQTANNTAFNILLVLLLLAPAVVATKYIRLLRGLGG